MKVKVDVDACTGCGPCESICPEVFEVVDDVAKVKVADVPAEAADACREAAENCPTEAIVIDE
ncbi:MAG: ferredoxin [Phycisphaerae bacterium]|jgi:ferredoxin|nr:ferredoxin [Phycisphaerae bacterium]